MKPPLFKGPGGTIEVERKVRSILSAAIKKSGKRREEVAAQMAADLGRDITAGMLRDFTRGASKGRNVRFPAAWITAFCKATGDDELLRFLLSPELAKALGLGEWLLGSRWVVEELQIKLPGSGPVESSKSLRKSRRPAARTANRP